MFGFGPAGSFTSCNFLIPGNRCRIILGASTGQFNNFKLTSSAVRRFARFSPLCGGRGGR